VSPTFQHSSCHSRLDIPSSGCGKDGNENLNFRRLPW
jgi:hypothetical protein